MKRPEQREANRDVNVGGESDAPMDQSGRFFTNVFLLANRPDWPATAVLFDLGKPSSQVSLAAFSLQQMSGPPVQGDTPLRRTQEATAAAAAAAHDITTCKQAYSPPTQREVTFLASKQSQKTGTK